MGINVNFINYSIDGKENTRIIVPSEYAKEKVDEIYKKLQVGGYVSLNKTYISFDKTIEQGDNIEYLYK